MLRRMVAAAQATRATAYNTTVQHRLVHRQIVEMTTTIDRRFLATSDPLTCIAIFLDMLPLDRQNA